MRRKIVMLLAAVCMATGAVGPAAASPASAPAPTDGTAKAPKKRVAIVIDDFGNRMDGTEAMLALDAPLTVAVMPFLPTTKDDATAAHARGHEVIVHLPMEPVRGKPSWLGPGAITTDLSDEDIRARVQAAIDDVPFARGMNNHMGSKATADSRVMRIVMEVCRANGLYYLDSRTSQHSKAEEEAAIAGVPVVANDLFLDEVYTSRHVSKQMLKLFRKIERQDVTIAIGHVGPPGRITSGLLRAALPKLRERAEIVPLSALLPFPTVLP